MFENICNAETLKKVKDFGYHQWVNIDNKNEADMVSFEHNGINIVYPWIDESARFEITDMEAVNAYGLENVENFMSATTKRLETSCFRYKVVPVSLLHMSLELQITRQTIFCLISRWVSGLALNM